MTEVRETARPTPPHQVRPHQTDDDRVVELLGRMTLEEKLAQIVGFWEKEDGEAVAPLQGAFGGVTKLDEFVRHGLGHLTRPYGTRPIDPVERASWLWAFQRGLVTGTRLGIPAAVPCRPRVHPREMPPAPRIGMGPGPREGRTSKRPKRIGKASGGTSSRVC